MEHHSACRGVCDELHGTCFSNSTYSSCDCECGWTHNATSGVDCAVAPPTLPAVRLVRPEFAARGGGDEVLLAGEGVGDAIGSHSLLGGAQGSEGRGRSVWAMVGLAGACQVLPYAETVRARERARTGGE